MKILVIGRDPGVADLCRTLAMRPGVLLYRTPAGQGPGRAIGIPPDQPVHLEAFVRREQPEAVIIAPELSATIKRLTRADYRAPGSEAAGIRGLLGWMRAARLQSWKLLVPAKPRLTLGVTGSTPDCTTCGACCFSPQLDYVLIQEIDEGRMGPELLKNLTVDIEGMRMMRMIGGHCVALRTDGGRFMCSIYEERPEVCRKFEQGEGDCRVARRERLSGVIGSVWAERHGPPPEGLLRSPLLVWRSGIVHAFTTREGGVSVGPLASLNLARRPDEEDAHLLENWHRVVSRLHPQLSTDSLAIVSQVHGREVLTVDAGAGPLAVVGEADALVTTTPGVVLAVRAADCVPVLLVAPGGVAAVHSGWRGTAAGVVPAAVAALAKATGAGPELMSAAIGPHISGAAYEVGQEVVDGLEGGGLDPEVFRVDWGGARTHVDLGAAIASQLEACGVAEVERLAGCTRTDQRFFSHRRDGPATGRQAALIALAPFDGT